MHATGSQEPLIGLCSQGFVDNRTRGSLCVAVVRHDEEHPALLEEGGDEVQELVGGEALRGRGLSRLLT